MNNIFLCLSAVSALIVIFAFFAFLRYMNYKETTTLAEKGLPHPSTEQGRGLLYWGIGITVISILLTVSLLIIGLRTGTNYPLGLGPWMLIGLAPLFLGLALLLIYYLSQKDT